MKRFTLLSLVWFLISGQALAGFEGETDTTVPYRNYPVPQRTGGLIFYVQRSHNKNTVIYELNYRSDGTLDPYEPLRALWIRFEEGGVRKELSMIQKHSYGLDIVPLSKDSWLIHFRSFKKRYIYLFRNGKSNAFQAIVKINGNVCVLTSLFLNTVTNSLGIPSVVNYIDVLGIDPGSDKPVVERINLNKKIK